MGLCGNAGPDGGHAHRLPGLLLQGQGGRGGGGGEGGGEGDGGERWNRVKLVTLTLKQKCSVQIEGISFRIDTLIA